MNQQLTACDIQSSRELISKIKETADKLIERVKGITEQIKTGEFTTKNGISFLDVKNELLGQYNLNIGGVVARKMSGISIEDCEEVDRLVEIRTYIEKSRPIEHKLKYQMEKLLKIAASGGLSNDDPLHLKPNPANMVSKLAGQGSDNSDSEENADGKNASGEKTGVYKPPMMSSSHYAEELSRKEREEKLIAKAKRKALSTAMMRELRAEYSEAPEEVREDMNLHRFKQSKEDKHRIAYEEDNFKRVAVSKQEKRRRSQLQTVSSLDQLTKFGDISALTGGSSGVAGGKKRKSKSKPKSGHKKKKIRM
ncbi:NGDN [Bugula neritina]|uniref:NGDN n=1 Tax=Bugula neritina TaxID=10212 RepID=A0A7J7IXX3_BUGNE|nr:NGDN [Bugula neritina]